MHITVAVLADSRNAKTVERGRITLKALTRQYDPADLSILPIEWLDDPNNAISIWSNVQAADIVVVMLSEELLDALDELTDYQSGNNLIAQEICTKRGDQRFRIIPLVLSACTWDEPGSIFKGMTSIPRSGPLSTYGNKDNAWALVGQEINTVIKDLQNPGAGAQPSRRAPSMSVSASTSQATTVVAPATCPRCDATIALGAKLCRNCGTTLGKSQPQAWITPDSVLVVASRKDKAHAEACIKHLRTIGLKVIDADEIVPGSRIDEDFKEKISRTRCALFLISADYLADQFCEPHSAPAKAYEQLTPAIVSKSFMVTIRPCAYDHFSIQGIQPREVLSTDGKPFASSRYAEASWVALSRLVKQTM